MDYKEAFKHRFGLNTHGSIKASTYSGSQKETVEKIRHLTAHTFISFQLWLPNAGFVFSKPLIDNTGWMKNASHRYPIRPICCLQPDHFR